MDDAKRPQDVLEGLTYTADAVQELLEGVEFPVAREALVAHLEGRNAPDDVVEGIRAADPPTFAGVADVLAEVGGYAI